MEEKKLQEIGKWLVREQGYSLDLTDQLWMEDYIGEHKFRDLVELLDDYSLSQLSEKESEINKYKEYYKILQEHGHDIIDRKDQEISRLKGLIDKAFEAGAKNRMKPFTTDLCGVHCPDLETWKRENNL